ncbi:MAG: corrinoid protein [Deltaproteobacteria bacterium]|jgi:5-methyltetrahydrofolate--homocysteine methyltransferase|nr:corrinoid protein [Deltaproteobacteria bacterium]MBW1749067.1 corrinoid protein [Deltaproteobacteria bacterium]MBW1827557.1 corrinoid protein [Deltaproteobacteria bacterium]MBW1970374.1 corrinoid protein [Deltaproteobacteria bacterium]MBW2157815.1 corrinoid protein [Deltaproteobacteria bacterium]
MEAKAIIDAVLDFDQEKTAQLIRDHLDQGADALAILDQALIAAMDEVGRQFSAGDFFVPEMLMAAEAMHAGLEVLGPHLARSDIKAKGTIVIGTVMGDNHDIGKNLVAMMLECAGYRVIDLGVNVSKGKFLAAAKKYQAHIVALSALLTTTLAEMEAVVADVRAKDGGSLKTLVGGAPVTASFAAGIGADGYSPDAAGAVSMARSLISA